MLVFSLVEGVFFPRGPLLPIDDADYIRTPSVQTSVCKIAAAVAHGHFPVLLEGETSTGKTSVVTHLALVTGHRVHRINNHEHTDIQEYVGSYVPNADNVLEFREGVLLKAVRNGDWVILDELNLAPTEVLEALNRVSWLNFLEEVVLCLIRSCWTTTASWWCPRRTSA